MCRFDWGISNHGSVIAYINFPVIFLMKINKIKYYYPYNGLKDGQRDGTEHESRDLDWDYEMDNEFVDYYNVRIMCRSVQHIIEVF